MTTPHTPSVAQLDSEPQEPATQPVQKESNLTWHGVKTVMRLELMQRVRSSKWKRMLLFWFIGVGAICVLFSTAISSINAYESELSVGPFIFATNAYFILFMGLLITPTLSSTAINGDREQGTLAILQASLISPIEITLGKLLASWIAALSFLIISVPFIFWAFAAGDVSARAVFMSIAAMALILLAVCAVSLYYSARSPKTAGSTMSSYGFVALVSVISLLMYGLLMSTTTTNSTATTYYASEYDPATGTPTSCSPQINSDITVIHGELFWPLLAINPFVLIADVSTPKMNQFDYSSNQDIAMSGIAGAVRSSRVLSNTGYSDSWCKDNGEVRTAEEHKRYLEVSDIGSPLWPTGIGFYLGIGALAVWRTSKRLETPYKVLHKGIRIA